MMSLEEAIEHCEEEVKRTERNYPYIDATEYKQLAEWLRELIHLRNITEYLRDFIDCFGSMDSMYYNEDIIEWAESELIVAMREVNADEDSD